MLIQGWLAVSIIVFFIVLMVMFGPVELSLLFVVGAGCYVGSKTKPAYGVICSIVVFVGSMLIESGAHIINDELRFKDEHVVGLWIASFIAGLPGTIALMLWDN